MQNGQESRTVQVSYILLIFSAYLLLKTSDNVLVIKGVYKRANAFLDMISCVVPAWLICDFVFEYAKSGFPTTRLNWLLGMDLLMVKLCWTQPGLKMDPT